MSATIIFRIMAVGVLVLTAAACAFLLILVFAEYRVQSQAGMGTFTILCGVVGVAGLFVFGLFMAFAALAKPKDQS